MNVMEGTRIAFSIRKKSVRLMTLDYAASLVGSTDKQKYCEEKLPSEALTKFKLDSKETSYFICKIVKSRAKERDKAQPEEERDKTQPEEERQKEKVKTTNDLRKALKGAIRKDETYLIKFEEKVYSELIKNEEIKKLCAKETESFRVEFLKQFYNLTESKGAEYIDIPPVFCKKLSTSPDNVRTSDMNFFNLVDKIYYLMGCPVSYETASLISRVHLTPETTQQSEIEKILRNTSPLSENADNFLLIRQHVKCLKEIVKEYRKSGKFEEIDEDKLEATCREIPTLMKKVHNLNGDTKNAEKSRCTCKYMLEDVDKLSKDHLLFCIKKYEEKLKKAHKESLIEQMIADVSIDIETEGYRRTYDWMLYLKMIPNELELSNDTTYTPSHLEALDDDNEKSSNEQDSACNKESNTTQPKPPAAELSLPDSGKGRITNGNNGFDNGKISSYEMEQINDSDEEIELEVFSV